MIFLYFSAYLTGIGALLERLNPPDVTTPLIADGFNATNFTLAANATIITAFGSVSVDDFDNGWWWILLVFYALVPVAGCALFGIIYVPYFSIVLRTIRQNTPSGGGTVQGRRKRSILHHHRTVRKEVRLVRSGVARKNDLP